MRNRPETHHYNWRKRNDLATGEINSLRFENTYDSGEDMFLLNYMREINEMKDSLKSMEKKLQNSTKKYSLFSVKHGLGFSPFKTSSNLPCGGSSCKLSHSPSNPNTHGIKNRQMRELQTLKLISRQKSPAITPPVPITINPIAQKLHTFLQNPLKPNYTENKPNLHSGNLQSECDLNKRTSSFSHHKQQHTFLHRGKKHIDMFSQTLANKQHRFKQTLLNGRTENSKTNGPILHSSFVKKQQYASPPGVLVLDKNGASGEIKGLGVKKVRYEKEKKIRKRKKSRNGVCFSGKGSISYMRKHMGMRDASPQKVGPIVSELKRKISQSKIRNPIAEKTRNGFASQDLDVSKKDGKNQETRNNVEKVGEEDEDFGDNYFAEEIKELELTNKKLKRILERPKTRPKSRPRQIHSEKIDSEIHKPSFLKKELTSTSCNKSKRIKDTKLEAFPFFTREELNRNAENQSHSSTLLDKTTEPDTNIPVSMSSRVNDRSASNSNSNSNSNVLKIKSGGALKPQEKSSKSKVKYLPSLFHKQNKINFVLPNEVLYNVYSPYRNQPYNVENIPIRLLSKSDPKAKRGLSNADISVLKKFIPKTRDLL